jgi:hypothetical protein
MEVSMENMVLVRVGSQYGREVVHPANNAAECLAAIAGTATLTTRTLELAKEMGFEIRQADQTLPSVLAGLAEEGN